MMRSTRKNPLGERRSWSQTLFLGTRVVVGCLYVESGTRVLWLTMVRHFFFGANLTTAVSVEWEQKQKLGCSVREAQQATGSAKDTIVE